MQSSTARTPPSATCGATLADETREGADPEGQEFDQGFALAESLGWHGAGLSAPTAEERNQQVIRAAA